jgi:hypothetical protein
LIAADPERLREFIDARHAARGALLALFLALLLPTLFLLLRQHSLPLAHLWALLFAFVCYTGGGGILC